MPMYDTVALDEARRALVIIDQTQLPNREALLYLTELEDMREAICALKVRGAPAIGVAASIAIYLEASKIARTLECRDNGNNDMFYAAFLAAKEKLNSARPTAVNLSWALNRMERAALAGIDSSAPLGQILMHLRDECMAIKDEDARICEAIGRHGLELLMPGMGLLTHCNAGRLATSSRYGTATAPIYLGHERGYGFKVFCDETRPLLQGARLTSYELCAAGIDTTLICDNMAAALMRSGRIGAVLVGCDRVAANGDTANKIGTLYTAIAAKHYGIPFYVFAPSPTIDFECDTGQSITIEQRAASEVTETWFSERTAPDSVKVFNPGFDVTSAELITAIITEYGVARPPYRESLKALRTPLL